MACSHLHLDPDAEADATTEEDDDGDGDKNGNDGDDAKSCCSHRQGSPCPKIAAVILKLDGIKFWHNEDADLSNTKKKNKDPKSLVDNILDGWAAKVDLDDLNYNQRRRCIRSKKHKNALKNIFQRQFKGKEDGKNVEFDMESAIKEIEAANIELNSRNNMIRLKNELLMVTISEKKLEIEKMHWEMCSLRESLCEKVDAHFEQQHADTCPHHHPCCGTQPGGGGGGGKKKPKKKKKRTIVKR